MSASEKARVSAEKGKVSADKAMATAEKALAAAEKVKVGGALSPALLHLVVDVCICAHCRCLQCCSECTVTSRAQETVSDSSISDDFLCAVVSQWM